mmetsp:Transcript_51577/g.115846  ORF Transcript_51577/g.115846 Transcript_51577/m.115846 type:complete len:225 (-) Transcript_51577:706-1380(-)
MHGGGGSRSPATFACGDVMNPHCRPCPPSGPLAVRLRSDELELCHLLAQLFKVRAKLGIFHLADDAVKIRHDSQLPVYCGDLHPLLTSHRGSGLEPAFQERLEGRQQVAIRFTIGRPKLAHLQPAAVGVAIASVQLLPRHRSRLNFSRLNFHGSSLASKDGRHAVNVVGHAPTLLKLLLLQKGANSVQLEDVAVGVEFADLFCLLEAVLKRRNLFRAILEEDHL